MLSFDPRNSEQLFFLGLAYEHAGRTAEALDRYSNAAALDSSSSDVQLGLARLALRANKVAEARQAADACSRACRPAPTRCWWPGWRPSGKADSRTRGCISSVRSRQPKITSTFTLRSAGSRQATAVAPRRGVTSSAPSNWIRRGARSSRYGSSASPRTADANRLQPRDRRRVLVRHGGVPPAERHSLRVGAVPQAATRAGTRHLRGTARWISLAALAACAAALAPWLRSGHRAPARSSPRGRWPAWRCSLRRCRSSSRRRSHWRSRCCRSCRPHGLP